MRARPGLYETEAIFVAKLTLTFSTPAVWDSCRSTVRAQAAHVIPPMGSATSSVAVFTCERRDSRVVRQRRSVDRFAPAHRQNRHRHTPQERAPFRGSRAPS